MNFDTIIIGGGLAGLTCGIRLAGEGLRCAVVAAGMNSLHFSSGSIDLIGYSEDGTPVQSPLAELASLAKRNPTHPYARCDADTVRQGLEFFRYEVQQTGLRLHANPKDNHLHATALGALKPTWMSQQTVYDEDIQQAFAEREAIAVLTFEGYRDFHPRLAVANLQRNPLFADRAITSGTLRLPEEAANYARELRSIDMSRFFDRGKNLALIAEGIDQAAPDARLVALPAVLGIRNHESVVARLREMTGRVIYETATLPPSILGMRLDNALKTRFAALGGVYIAGDRVVEGRFESGRLIFVHTENYGDMPLSAPFFVMATGSFLSGGLASDAERMREPVFGLAMDYPEGRSNWYRPDLLNTGGHPFLECGIAVNENFNPSDAKGRTLSNLFCAGAALAGYNPVAEASGGGVAITTGYRAAGQILG